MANTRVVFIGVEPTGGAEIQVNQIYDTINIGLVTLDGLQVGIFLDIPTAIKFSKTLRHEISKAKEDING